MQAAHSLHFRQTHPKIRTVVAGPSVQEVALPVPSKSFASTYRTAALLSLSVIIAIILDLVAYGLIFSAPVLSWATVTH